ncbi:hypothetical protein Tco_1492936 [Tanacetum coccineum]
MNQNYFEPNSNYSGFDQPSQYPIDQSPLQEISIQDMEDLKQQYLDEMKSICNQIQIKDYRNERIEIRYRKECEIKIDELKGKFNGMTFVTFQFFDDDDYEESTIPLHEIISQIHPSITITTILPTMEPEDSLIIGDENLSTIPEKESDEFIKSSVEDLVPIPSDYEDTSDSDSECDLPFCDNSVIFSNPLFDSNDDFTSSDDESLTEKTDENPLFDEVLEDIESEDSYVSKLDDPDLLVTPLSAFNKDECFDPGGDIDEIDAFLDIVVSPDFEDDYYDSEGEIIYLESCLLRTLFLISLLRIAPDYEDSRAREIPSGESKPPLSTDKVTPSDEHRSPPHPKSPYASQHKEPTSTEHQSPTPDESQPESSKSNKSKQKKAKKPKRITRKSKRKLGLLGFPQFNTVMEAVKDDPALNAKVIEASGSDPDDPVLIDYDIDGKMYKITYDELQDHLNKKENPKKALKEGEFSKLVIIKDELGAILPKKTNKCIGEMMTSLSNRYERLKKILEYLGLDLTLPLPQQDPSLPRRKRKVMELDPETYIVGLHYNRTTS